MSEKTSIGTSRECLNGLIGELTSGLRCDRLRGAIRPSLAELLSASSSSSTTITFLLWVAIMLPERHTATEFSCRCGLWRREACFLPPKLRITSIATAAVCGTGAFLPTVPMESGEGLRLPDTNWITTLESTTSDKTLLRSTSEDFLVLKYEYQSRNIND